MALVADYGIDSDESEEEMQTDGEQPNISQVNPEQSEEILEDFVKKTNYGDTPLEKPPPKPPVSTLSHMRLMSAKGSKGKIQISIPKLQDSDSDEDQPKPKKLKESSGASGFLGSLPPPRGSTGGKKSGINFIPYTLTKNKPAAPSKPVKSSTKSKPQTNKATKLTETYSDSDEDDTAVPSQLSAPSGNFFSLDSEPDTSHRQYSGAVNTAPVIKNVAMEEERTQPMVTAASLYNMTDDGDYSGYYNNTDNVAERADNSTSNVAERAEKSTSNDVEDLLQDEQFLRLQGKKQRGKEIIELIDVHTDDQRTSEIELTKNISEEVDPAAFAHRKKGEGPSGQQKRKHHITYLAFQAKERELELKNTWADNRANKQQTQAKYGF